jgi:hypothetical protein
MQVVCGRWAASNMIVSALPGGPGLDVQAELQGDEAAELDVLGLINSHILSTSDPSGHRNWPVMSATRKLAHTFRGIPALSATVHPSTSSVRCGGLPQTGRDIVEHGP